MKEIITLDNIKRDFHVGDETVHALRGVSFTIREGSSLRSWEPPAPERVRC